MTRVPWRAALAGFAALLLAGAAAAQPPVWIVRDHDSEMVLFGSVHVLPPDVNWEPAALKAALAHADDLWFELPIDAATQARTAQLATSKGALPPDQSLFKLLPPKDAARLLRVALANGVSTAVLDRLQPWLADIALSAAAFRKAGAEGDDGVEKSVAAQAPAEVRRRAFETADQQISMLADAPRADQIASLRETMDELEHDPNSYREMLHAWMAGDVRALEHEALDPVRKSSPVLFRRLVTDRNARWTAILDQRLKGHGHTVVIVGMAHLVGKDGVPARLRALGYQVQGP